MRWLYGDGGVVVGGYWWCLVDGCELLVAIIDLEMPLPIIFVFKYNM